MSRFGEMAGRVAAAAQTLYGAVAAAGDGLRVKVRLGARTVEYVGRAVDSWDRVDFGPSDRRESVPVTYSVVVAGARADALEPGRSSRVSVKFAGEGGTTIAREELTLRMGSEPVGSAREFLERDVPRAVSEFVARHADKIGEGRDKEWRDVQRSYGPGSRSGD